MGYHDAREIPNYWTYAQDFVLQDDMFEPNSSWSWPEHLFEVSAWSAKCEEHGEWSENPLSWVSAVEGPPILITNPTRMRALKRNRCRGRTLRICCTSTT